MIEVIAFKRGYRVTENGDLINPKGERVGYACSSGYMYTSIRIDGKKKNLAAHRLQAFQKYGVKLFENGIVTRHKNNDKLDNSWDNILIGTNHDNQMDVPIQIRIKRAMHATSFVRKYPREEVKKFYQESKSYKKTMEHFNISSKGTLHFILNG